MHQGLASAVILGARARKADVGDDAAVHRRRDLAELVRRVGPPAHRAAAAWTNTAACVAAVPQLLVRTTLT